MRSLRNNNSIYLVLVLSPIKKVFRGMHIGKASGTSSYTRRLSCWRYRRPQKFFGEKLLWLTIFLFVYGCSANKDIKTESLSPEDVVKSYFNLWNNKNYEKMWQTLSDGFKKIDPYAKDLQTFSNYMAKYFESGNDIILKSVKESSNDGTTATVDYTILMRLKSEDKEFSGTYTLKKRSNGWKLIHPYGENIDRT